jgi:hypothetical protein
MLLEVYALHLSRDLAYIVGVALINSTLCNTFHQHCHPIPPTGENGPYISLDENPTISTSFFFLPTIFLQLYYYKHLPESSAPFYECIWLIRPKISPTSLPSWSALPSNGEDASDEIVYIIKTSKEGV